MNSKTELLKAVSPFNLLPMEVLEEVSEILQVVEYKKETLAYRQEITKMKGVDIIVKGQYETFFYDGAENKRSIEIHHPGYCFGGISILLNRKRALKSVMATKGTVVYSLPRKDFIALCNGYEEFYQYYTADFGNRMLDEEFAHFFKKPASFEESYIASEQLYSRKIEGVTYRAIVSCPQTLPIFEAAQLMAQHKISCLFIKDDNDQIIGYATDITLRDNVIAKCLDPRQEIKTVMDNPIVSISYDAYIYEAILMMFRTKTKYLLVEKDNNYIGFLSRNRLLSEQAQSPLVFIQSVKLAVSSKELKEKWERVPNIVNQLLGRGVHAEIVNQVITTIADTIAIKVIEKVLDKMGQAPAKFAFMVTGSEGRKEQTLRTDQDNAIIYEDKANEQRETVRAYFLEFAKQVSDQLNEIGFEYCKGGYMASNPQWTHSLSHWKRNYKSWMEDSLPESAIKFSTFFDCRYLYGDRTIIHELKEFLDEELKTPMNRFFAYIAKNALQYKPPLTFFNNIRTQTIGKIEVFDIKNAMTPVVDLVRVYALQNRIFAENTGERLKALKEKGVFSESQFHELMHSYYYLMSMRLKNQANQIIQDKKEPDNYIDLKSITKIEQVTLKEIFKVIDNFQEGIKIRFTNNLLG
jgi:CBS domain-containing protein